MSLNVCLFLCIPGDPSLKDKQSDVTFSLHLKMVTALAFVPVDDVRTAFDDLIASPFFAENDELLENYLRYFLRTWIGDFNARRIRQPPKYPIELWNCRYAVLNYLGKTNNYSESFNRAFLTLLSVSHPVVPKFAEGVRKQQILTVYRMEQFISNPSQNSRTNAVVNAQRLKGAVEKYGTVPLLEFLRAVAYCT